MPSTRTYVKIVFDLEVDDDDWRPVASESLNAYVDGDSFVLDNTPYYVKGVALGDRVAASPIPEAPHRYRFDRVLEESGAKALSIIFLRDDAFEAVTTWLQDRGCWLERDASKMVAVEVPAGTAYAPIRRRLLELEADETLSFAELAIASGSPRFEPVHSISDYWDQPRSGVAALDGATHWFECRFDEHLDDHDDYDVKPVSPTLAAWLAKRDSVWRRWRSAFDAGATSKETHPALPAERPRYDELEVLIGRELATIEPFPALGSFRRTAEPDGWAVAWTR